MLTRYQAKSNKYNMVLTEPLILSEIMSYLSPRDIINLKISGYSRDTRYHDTIDRVLERRYEQHRLMVFSNGLNELMDNYDIEQSIYEQVRSMNTIFDYILENNWFRSYPCSDVFYDLFEGKLIEFVHCYEYTHNALYYLAEIFGIFVKAENDENGDMIEYILDSKGVKHYLNND